MKKILITIAIVLGIVGFVEYQRYSFYKGFVAGFEDGTFWQHDADGIHSLADSCLELDEAYKVDYAKLHAKDKNPGTGDYESIKKSCAEIRQAGDKSVGPREPFKWIPFR
jgi:hypothetical protein